MDLVIKGNINGITWNNKERSGLGKISNLKTRIESLLVKSRSLEIKTWSFCTDDKRISNKVWEKEFSKNIPLRIDLYKRRLDPCLSVTTSPRFSEHVYMGNYTKIRSFLWDRMHSKFKVAIFIWIVKGLEFVFGPKWVFSQNFQMETGRWIKSIWAIDCFYK